MRKKLSCYFCKTEAKTIDYKDDKLLRRYLTTSGKILPAKVTGTCAWHQRKLKKAIKRARQVALLPFVESYYV